MAKLGFDLVKTNQRGEAVCLLGNPNYVPTLQSGRTDSSTAPAVGVTDETKPKGKSQQLEVNNHYVTVRLLQAVRIPAHHSQLVHARADKDEGHHLVLFEERKSKNQDISVTTYVTELSKDNGIVVAIENYGLQPVVLEEGCEIGYLEPIELVPEEVEACTLAATRKEQTQSKPFEMSPRVEKLLDQLDLEETLTEAESCKLKDLTVKFSDVFALDPSELGRTDVVQHTVDTSTHQPIRQLLYRVSFALRKRTEELVESLKQGVITNSNSPGQVL